MTIADLEELYYAGWITDDQWEIYVENLTGGGNHDKMPENEKGGDMD